MLSTAVAASVLAAIAALPAVNAHGYVENVIMPDGTVVFAGDPTWPYKTNPQQPGWFAMNQDNGFVAPAEYGNPDIICHKNATPGSTSITVAAGQTIGLQWNTWPDSHHGPVINSLAAVSGSFSSIDKTALSWFVAQEGGLVNDNPPPGQ
jgi:lytic cellulose monooxygenase (C1-hydroxylating)